jgi:hypothetical protein
MPRQVRVEYPGTFYPVAAKVSKKLVLSRS